jgi:hypothetical protein
MIDRASFSVRFPIDNKYMSFDRRGFAKLPIYFHSITTLLSHRIANAPVLALKHVVAG